MTVKNKFYNKLLSVLLCVALVLAYIPASVFFSEAAEASGNRVVDPSTMDIWKPYLLPENGDLSTESAGAIITDKSVFTDATALPGVTKNSPDSFLVALSAIASNMTVTGMSSVPTDTMLVLDVSGSMNSSNNNVAEELVEAANTSIHTLLTDNRLNRVGVVLYAASSPAIVLPLGRYTTGADNAYLAYSSTGGESVSLDNNTVIEGTSTAPSSTSKAVSGGTYIQSGIQMAMEQFTANSNSTTVNDTVLGTLKRKPVMVLMSDGAPTYGSTYFETLESRNLGDGSSSTAALGFTTQLTAAYAKQAIEAKYGADCLFYTLGLGTGNSTIATSVLNPSASSSAINEFWTSYNALEVNEQVRVQSGWFGLNSRYVTKTATSLDRYYVDKYFNSADYTNASLAEALKQAFEDIVADISLQSAYFPTLISGSEDLSGYVSFVDKIGQYMNVTDVKGMNIGDKWFYGNELAKNFVADGGLLGSFENPTALGDELVWAVQARIGLKTTDEARTLIGLAYEYGQLSYTDDNNFSNYIGWYANAAGEFLGFWHEGITTMPNPHDGSLTDATRPVYIMKSYGYLGATDHGVTGSDMLYTTVQVREDILTGEQSVLFAVPAALIPVVSYEVTLNEVGDLTDLKATGATAPIRLVYEVELWDSINSFNVKDEVSLEYLAANTNEDGSINFYTNQYEVDNTTGYGKVNTYSYFRPSRQNDRYYYQEDTRIYTDTNGAEYTGTTQPTGTMYHAYTVYKKVGSSFRTEVVYHQLTAEALAASVKSATDNTWYIPAGSVRRDYNGYTVAKNPNSTGTLTFSDAPFTDIEGYNVSDQNHDFVFGVTMGNNGKLTLQAETGIRLSKLMADPTQITDASFEFVITNTSNTGDNSLYPAWKLTATGEEDTSVQFTNGKATVTLKADEVLYIGGMTPGDIFTVTETETTGHKVQTVWVDYEEQPAPTVTIELHELVDVAFVNTVRGTGNLTITKEIQHPFGTEYPIPDKTFTVTVTLSGVGTANATFPATHSGDGTLTSVTTDANGKVTETLKLKPTQQISVIGLPEGTEVTVVEQEPGTGFTPAYWDNGILGDGKVTVEAGATATVIVLNDYQPTEVYPVNITVSGTKTLTGREWDTEDSFLFELQKWNADTSTWSVLSTQEVKGTDADKSFDFNGAFGNEHYTAAGTYYYRVVEAGGTQGGIVYDKTVHSFAVDVADMDMDGALEITAVRASRPDSTHIDTTATGWHVTVNFTNTYSATGDTTVTVDINKTVNNPSGSTLAILSGFTFGLYDADGTLMHTSQPTTDRGFTRFVLTGLETGVHKYTLKEIVPDPVPAGWTYSTVEIPVTVEIRDDGNGHRSAVIYTGDNATDATNGIEVTFTNDYVPGTAELTVDFVNKELQNKALVGNDFSFAIYSYDPATGIETPVTEGRNNAAGKVLFNDRLTFDKVGTYFFNIKETSVDGSGITTDKSVYRVTVTVTDVNGVLTATYEVVNVVGNQITFVNTYTTLPVIHSILGTKSLTGRALMNDEFTFVLTEALDAAGNIAEGAKTYEAKNMANGSISFPEITYTAAGDYYYVVSERSATGNTYGITYDPTQFVVTVTVADDGYGNLYVKPLSYTVKGNGAANGIIFNNTYQAAPTQSQVSGNKVLTGKVLTEGAYQFELYAADANWEQGDKLETVSNAADGTITFKAISYEKIGHYNYLVKEVHGGETIDGVIYDGRTFRVQIRVTDDLRGNLHAQTVIFDEENVPQEQIEFLNLYEITGGGTVTFSGEKTLTGKTLTDGQFTFALYETDESFEIGGDPLRTATNQEGKFSISIDYTAEQVNNTYYYAMREQNHGQTLNGITYSDRVYHITVQVLDNGVGGIKTVVTVVGASLDTLNFTNSYHAAETTVLLEGEKTLEGRDLEADEFAFLLHTANEDFTVNTDIAPKKVYNKADGTFAFEALPFTQPGAYFFLITEDATVEAERVTFDKAIYQVAVYVTDDGNGRLVAEVEITQPGKTELVEKITFQNKYTPKPEDVAVSILVEKTVESTGDKTVSPEGFSFLLERADGNKLTVKSDAQGKAQFDLTFTEADIGKTYTYKLTEINDGQAHIKYSKAQYDISITVSLTEANELVAAVTVGEKPVDTAVCEFINEYDYIPKTGDTMNLSLWLAVLFVSGSGVLLTSVVGLKKKETNG